MVKKTIAIVFLLLIAALICCADNFTENLDNTVQDTDTGLMWQQYTANIDGDTDDKVSWKQALIYCESLELAGYGDWRLPNVKELRSLVNYQKINPAIDSNIFSNTKEFTYWTSTSYSKSGQPDAIAIDFTNGLVTYRHKTNSNEHCYVRAVRGGM